MPKSSSRYFQLPPVTHKLARTLKTSVEYCTDCVFQQTKERTWQKILWVLLACSFITCRCSACLEMTVLGVFSNVQRDGTSKSSCLYNFAIGNNTDRWVMFKWWPDILWNTFYLSNLTQTTSDTPFQPNGPQYITFVAACVRHKGLHYYHSAGNVFW